ncbi:MAG: DUF3108 domain-containing protein, partial [Elusimicrobia bacterium]|nr:DUF3108 domain-containing protein [Elusimicrobiota bacterium]
MGRMLFRCGAAGVFFGVSLGFLKGSLSGYASAEPPVLSETALLETARTIGLGREGYIYSVQWGLWRVGRATLGATEIVRHNGRESYHIISSANSLPYVDTFYRVRDRNESWLDTETFLSLGFGKYLREGRFYRHEIVLYDHEDARFSATVRKRDGQIILENGFMKAKAYDV